MNFTCLYSNSSTINRKSSANNRPLRWLAFCLLSMLPPAASSDALVTGIEGEVMIKLPGDSGQMKLYRGTLLPDYVETTTQSTDARYWVLCPGSDMSQIAQPQEGLYQPCPKKESRTMRGAEDENAPFILLPNQSALEKLERILWSGPKDNDYSIMLFQYDAEGLEERVMEWVPENDTYQENGIHEFIPEAPLPLVFSENKEVTYKLEIENIDISQSSSTFDEILIKPITQPPPHTLMENGYKLLHEQNVERHTTLGELILAAYLLGKEQRAEAYSLLSELQRSHYRAQAQILKAKTLYQPGAPTDIIIKQYGEALEFAVADSDGLSSFIACQGVFSPSPLLLSDEGLEYQKQISQKPEFTRYCRKP